MSSLRPHVAPVESRRMPAEHPAKTRLLATGFEITQAVSGVARNYHVDVSVQRFIQLWHSIATDSVPSSGNPIAPRKEIKIVCQFPEEKE